MYKLQPIPVGPTSEAISNTLGGRGVASYRSSFALDLIEDHDLIERLVALQEERRASDVIRTALYEHLLDHLRDYPCRLQHHHAIRLLLSHFFHWPLVQQRFLV